MEVRPSSTTSSEHETMVPWPICALILFVLAINTMAQPGGRLCGHHRLRRTYLISSPLMCIYDILFVPYLPSLHLRELFSRPLHGNNSPAIPNASLHLSQTRNSMLWHNAHGYGGYSSFSGPLPAAILLAGMKGVLWTQIIGFIFLTDWLVGELLIYLSTTSAFSPGDHEDVPDMPALMSFTGYTFVAFTILGWTALLWTPFLHWESLQQNPSFSLAINLVFICAVPVCIAWTLALGPEVLGLGRFLERHMTLSKWLCLAFPEHDGFYFLDTGAWHYAVVFLANVVLTILMYALYYDPMGTGFPSWFKTSGA